MPWSTLLASTEWVVLSFLASHFVFVETQEKPIFYQSHKLDSDSRFSITSTLSTLPEYVEPSDLDSEAVETEEQAIDAESEDLEHDEAPPPSYDRAKALLPLSRHTGHDAASERDRELDVLIDKTDALLRTSQAILDSTIDSREQMNRILTVERSLSMWANTSIIIVFKITFC
jgi:hypothetical protein